MLQTIEDTAPSKKGNGLHYAFIICLGGFLTQAIVLSCQRLPAVALEPIRQTLGVSYADVGLITSVFMIFYAGLSIVWGMLGDKIGTRWAMTIACGLASIGALLFGLGLGQRRKRLDALENAAPADSTAADNAAADENA